MFPVSQSDNQLKPVEKLFKMQNTFEPAKSKRAVYSDFGLYIFLAAGFPVNPSKECERAELNFPRQHSRPD